MLAAVVFASDPFRKEKTMMIIIFRDNIDDNRLDTIMHCHWVDGNGGPCVDGDDDNCVDDDDNVLV